jgi:hypothetical protein
LASGKVGLEYGRNDPYYEGKAKCVYFIPARMEWQQAKNYCEQNIKYTLEKEYSATIVSIHSTGKILFYEAY